MRVIAISGPTCSGKTTIAQNLVNLIPGSILVSQDDFYLPDSQIPQTKNVANWDCPGAFDLEKFQQVLENLHKGVKPEYKHYEKSVVEIKHQPLEVEPVAIVEGIMMYQSPKILAEFDLKILIKGDKDTLRQRRSGRTYDTVEGEWADPPNYFDEIVWPEYESNYGFLEEESQAQKLGIEVVQGQSLDEMLARVIELVSGFRT